MKIFLSTLASFIAFDLSARQIQEATFSYWNKPDINIFYSTPKFINQKTKIIFLIHGDSRDAKKSINDWLQIARDRNVVLVAPKFSDDFYSEYSLLMISNEKGRLLNNKSMHLDNSLGILFDFFHSKLKLSTLSYRLYGYSKGSEFVQRYLLFSNDTRVDKVAMANSGFYTFVDDQVDFPFGTKNMNLSNQRIEWFMRLKGGVFLSDNNIKKIDRTLIKTRKAKKQGKNRLDRGANFFNDLTMLGVEKSLAFRWRYQLVPSGTEGNNEIIFAVSEFLLEDL
jgi:hypothetical protein